MFKKYKIRYSAYQICRETSVKMSILNVYVSMLTPPLPKKIQLFCRYQQIRVQSLCREELRIFAQEGRNKEDRYYPK